MFSVFFRVIQRFPVLLHPFSFTSQHQHKLYTHDSQYLPSTRKPTLPLNIPTLPLNFFLFLHKQNAAPTPGTPSRNDRNATTSQLLCDRASTEKEDATYRLFKHTSHNEPLNPPANAASSLCRRCWDSLTRNVVPIGFRSVSFLKRQDFNKTSSCTSKKKSLFYSNRRLFIVCSFISVHSVCIGNLIYHPM